MQGGAIDAAEVHYRHGRGNLDFGELLSQYEILLLLLGIGIVGGAFAAWRLGPKRGMAFVAGAVRRVALILLALFLIASVATWDVLLLLARGSLATVLGFFFGGLTQALAMALTERYLSGGRPTLAMIAVTLVWAILVVLLAILPSTLQ